MREPGEEIMHAENLEVLSPEEGERLLKSHDLGRFAIVVDGQPEIFPVNYAFDEGVVVFRTGPGLKLERGPLSRAAFEVDRVDTTSRQAWSVVVKGTAQYIGDAIDPLPERLRRLAVHPRAPGERTEWMAVYADSISGRRFVLPPVGETPWINR